jgi:class 3 adenylate cyclase/CheY-like chemotaxis protein
VKPSLKHDLRTPLNHIIGYCELLIEESGERGLQGLVPDLQRIHSAGKRLLGVINDLFDPAKTAGLQNDRSLIHHEVRTPLNQIIGYVEMLQEEAQDRDDSKLLSDLRKIDEAARLLLRLVVEHLLPGDNNVVLLQAAAPSGATTFLKRDSPSANRPAATALTGALLLADDDEANRDMLSRRLTRLGHTVMLAANGREALERIRAQSFELLLLDIQMPEMNGYQVLEHFKSDPALRALPVLVLSASDDTDRIAHCIELGAEDYLPKPFDPALLQARIGACLEKKRLRDREVSYLRQIEEEKRRSDELLHIILPHDVAEELKSTNAVKPRRFENVAVLFCDIVGFTAYCDQHPPEEILKHLQSLVESFETLTAEHGLEKIKTIGDSFMATAGLLAPLPKPALAAARCGLAMTAAAGELPPHWQVRVGVHLGPVIAGVVGRRKYQFDVWGDTVNTAARMEQASAPGAVSVNADTWASLAADCRGESQGVISIKGKGEHEIFRILEARPPS